MPLKSWTYTIGDHTLRAEIWWRFTGWYRKRLFIDHRRADVSRGRFDVSRPLKATDSALGPVTVRFTRRRLGLDMDCVVSGANIPGNGASPSVEKRRRYSVYEEGVDRPASPLGCFVFIPIILFFWTLAIPLSLLAALYSAAGFVKRSERRFQQRMRNAGRFVDWSEIEKRSTASPSTLIIQGPGMQSPCFWWTEDDLPAISPLPVSQFREALGHGRGWRDPFTVWSWFIYLSDRHAKARLTQPPDDFLDRLDVFEDNEACQAQVAARYPTLKLVVVSHPRKQVLRAGPEFAQALGDDLPTAVPKLLDLLNSRDEFLRQLALDTLGMAGPAAAPALPRLAHHFYFGPWDDMHWVTQALLAVGPTGLEFLQSAARWHDPVHRHYAELALNQHAYDLAHPKEEAVRRPLPSTHPVNPLEAPPPADARPRRLKLNVILPIAYWIALIATCVWVFIRLGVLAAVAAFFLLLFLSIVISLIPGITGILWRYRQLKRNPPELPSKTDEG